LDKNQGAMAFTQEELAPIVDEIKTRLKDEKNAKDSTP